MHIVHLTASTHFGGPERQMLGLARALPRECRTTFLSFAEGGRCAEFLGVVAEAGFAAAELAHDTPRFRAALRDLTTQLQSRQADVLLCHGYKANLLGRIAARRVGIPAVAVSRGWTGENPKVRLYERLDRWHLRWMDHVVAVSEGQAARVFRAGVPSHRVTVIRNSARWEAFTDPDPSVRARLLELFPEGTPVEQVILAAGRLSPEKGFEVLVEAAARVLAGTPTVGFLVFGEGAERGRLEQRVQELGIGDRFRLPGFTRELDQLLPGADILAQSSFTEGLPNVVLEASAAGVPVVATAVGGTPEAVEDGETGYLVPPGDPRALAERLTQLLKEPETRRRMGAAGKQLMRDRFSFEAQAAGYLQLFESLGLASISPVACGKL